MKMTFWLPRMAQGEPGAEALGLLSSPDPKES